LVINGASNGTAGFSGSGTLNTPADQMPYGESLASGPVLKPAIYNPNAAPGSRWSSAGLSASTIPRLYHSGAILLPDASVLVAGSNPNLDVNTTAPYPTTYQAEVFYPPYWSTARPIPTGVPTNLSYGGPSFDITIPASSYHGSGNTAAESTIISIIRGGFTTHAMNMGQRFLQLNNTYTVNSDASITYHVSQVPPNPNLFTPGPAMLFVTVNGVPSNGTFVIVGTGSIEEQPVEDAAALPASIQDNAADGSGSSKKNGASTVAPTLWVSTLVAAAALLTVL